MLRLTEYREQKGLTRSELARICGWSSSLQTKLEKGDIELKERQIRRIAEALRIHPGELFGPLPVPSLDDIMGRMSSAQRRSIEAFMDDQGEAGI